MKRWVRRLLVGFALASLGAWIGRRGPEKRPETRSENPGSPRKRGSARAGGPGSSNGRARGSSQRKAETSPARSADGPPAPLPKGLAADSPWASRAACLARVRAGGRLPRSAGRARLVAWNVRWFPDGGPGKGPSEHPTDVEWLACALAYLDADVFALAEVKAYPRAQQKLDQVRARLDAFTQGSHQARLDDCQPAAAQHVALLWNAKRVKAQDFEVFAELNPLYGPCQSLLRPGLGARFRFSGGLDVEVVAVHLKSGEDPRAQALRERSTSRLRDVLEAVKRRHQDDDLIVLGDFNVMGCPHCSPPNDGAAERQTLSSRLAQGKIPFSVLPTKPACSHYFSSKAGLLDLVVAPSAVRELGTAPEVSASGLCGELACSPLPRALPAAHRELSDHCPIVVDLLDQDLD